MNINKLQAQLQHVPDQALIGYVQNPDGQVPSYLALAEITRRKEIRKAAAPQQAAPTQTVAAQELAQAEPGIAQLPLKDEQMFSEQSYATGGIVAFTKGGLSEADLAYKEAIGNTFLDKGYRGVSNMMRGIGNYGADVATDWATLPGQLRWVRDPVSGKLVHAYESEGWMPRSSPNAPDRLTAIEGANAALTKGREDQYPGVTKNAADMYDAAMADKNASMMSGIASSLPVTEQAAKATGKTGKVGRSVPVGVPAVLDASGGYEIPTVTAAKLDLPQGLSTLDALNQRRQAMAEAGVDTDFFQKQQDKLAAEKAALGGEKEKAGWMALARAGLGMAGGKSQHAIQNIAEGAMGGLDQYGRDVKEIKQDEKLLRQADQKLAEAKYMQDRGDADAAMSAMKEREALINSTNIKNIEFQQQANIAKAGLEGDRSKTMYTQTQENKRATEHNAIQRMIANKAPAEIALIDRYMTDPKFATSYDKMNAGKKELQTMQDMRELFIKAKKDDPTTYGDMTFSQFANSFSSSGPAAKLPALDSKSASKYFK